ncbi:uncharacterized protein N7511_005161 [Penicillium nucicola]|uniref:uncharacterized protein n=1 Tax=Penicillium nucicola TaxID=1850975 RepID=UPI0025457679|nr:uncharacterized protein N7511_005161 [Penicillium nucicola]KAJ5761779.1 hypothetical protein N7511_005161 [Penicillium nucicola]
MVRADIQSCLCEGAQEWHNPELSDLERIALRTYQLEDEDRWIMASENCFKQLASTALNQLLGMEYGWNDVSNTKSHTAWT